MMAQGKVTPKEAVAIAFRDAERYLKLVNTGDRFYFVLGVTSGIQSMLLALTQNDAAGSYHETMGECQRLKEDFMAKCRG